MVDVVDSDDLAEEWARVLGDDDDEVDDDLAAEWESMVGDDGNGNASVLLGAVGGRESTRVLNQDEIDSLLGFSDVEDDEPETGILAILKYQNLVTHSRIPEIQNIFETIAKQWKMMLYDEFGFGDTTSRLDNIVSIRLGDYLNSVPLPTMLHQFEVNDWGPMFLAADSSFIYSCMNGFAGGKKSISMRIEGRPFTYIEKNILERGIFQPFADIIANAFRGIGVEMNIKEHCLETNPRYVLPELARYSGCVVAKIRLDFGDNGGRTELIIPFQTLDAILFYKEGDLRKADPLYRREMPKIMHNTEIPLTIGQDMKMELGDILRLKVGDVLQLGDLDGCTVKVADRVVASCDAQRSSKKITIK